uniref:Reverse transcriptase domain-containing protein n=1 Tax=Chromera velia CCMP2878 TaxID=1169474 RepID=A0A0G4GBP0_9ALVE|eukprot:Cvel_21075.t1-p1 / transcript=Cvel_21075.t1 / gene=Cvel_21075 / organism=Chromera_velia_CCMP2878 / gene_product=Retrovirus-related Pol polyprotein from transposon, putative / transcript_product=Retrovirus-related Pol polyprotein from transposon, putative / location=Cvel_scaffold1948:10287-13308(-) / protein_length=710 / sequence_SO=supercontig / SO=protein_coding / is_pseudo=false
MVALRGVACMSTMPVKKSKGKGGKIPLQNTLTGQRLFSDALALNRDQNQSFVLPSQTQDLAQDLQSSKVVDESSSESSGSVRKEQTSVKRKADEPISPTTVHHTELCSWTKEELISEILLLEAREKAHERKKDYQQSRISELKRREKRQRKRAERRQARLKDLTERAIDAHDVPGLLNAAALALEGGSDSKQFFSKYLKNAASNHGRTASGIRHSEVVKDFYMYCQHIGGAKLVNLLFDNFPAIPSIDSLTRHQKACFVSFSGVHVTSLKFLRHLYGDDSLVLRCEDGTTMQRVPEGHDGTGETFGWAADLSSPNPLQNVPIIVINNYEELVKAVEERELAKILYASVAKKPDGSAPPFAQHKPATMRRGEYSVSIEAKVFSALDYISGFQQLHMHPDHAEKTAFVTPFGLYKFTKMPFVLVNAFSVFQRAINLVLAGLSRDLALVYVDDIIVFSRSHDEHIQDLREVLGLVRKANLKLKLEKAQIAMTEVEYLGHTVSEKGVKPSRKNIRKILQWKPPQDRKELRSFLYLCSYYRHFITGFARLSFPLFQMLLLQAADEQGRPVLFVWNGKREEIFGKLKERLTTPPILGFPDISLPFRVKPDACEVSAGGVFTQQMQKRREVVIAYVSRGLSAAEKNYSPTEREALGAVYCCKQWRHYLFRGAAHVITDHKPNLAMSDRKVANKRVHNWALELQEYGLTFVHKKGRNM